MKNQSKKPNTWNEIGKVVDKFERCDHYFEFIDDDCRCRKCNMGLIGVYSLKDGKPKI